MNKAWTDIHWRGLAVAVVALGVVAAAQAGGGRVHSTSTLERAQTSLRELPAPTNFLAANANLASAKASRSGRFDKQLAACAAQSHGYSDRDAQCALSSTITMTTANIVDRNATHTVTIADARPYGAMALARSQ